MGALEWQKISKGVIFNLQQFDFSLIPMPVFELFVNSANLGHKMKKKKQKANKQIADLNMMVKKKCTTLGNISNANQCVTYTIIGIFTGEP